MKDTNNAINTNEIRKQAAKLFSLIEGAIKEHHWDTVSEAIAEQMGGFLKSSAGFKELDFAYDLSKTKSEIADQSLDEATTYMTEDALSDLYDLASSANELAKIVHNGESTDSITKKRVYYLLREIKKHAPVIIETLTDEWRSRSRDYRLEIRLETEQMKRS